MLYHHGLVRGRLADCAVKYLKNVGDVQRRQGLHLEFAADLRGYFPVLRLYFLDEIILNLIIVLIIYLANHV